MFSIVLAGSGTTLIAAEQLDRAWLGAELNEIGIQRTIDRMKAENVIQKDSGEETEHLIIKGHLELIKQDMLQYNYSIFIVGI